MAITPEGKVKAEVKKILGRFEHKAWYFMPVQTGYGKPALDFIVCLNGKFVAIETKATSEEKMTVAQVNTAREILAAGGDVLRVDNDTVQLLEARLLLLCPKQSPLDTVSYP